jgi:hypothetical protein
MRVTAGMVQVAPKGSRLGFGTLRVDRRWLRLDLMPSRLEFWCRVSSLRPARGPRVVAIGPNAVAFGILEPRSEFGTSRTG